MKRLGVDLGAMDAKYMAPTSAPDCGGGLLRVTRYDYDQWTENGERFETKRHELPATGYGSARIRCGNQVGELPKTASGFVQFYGLCHSCSAAEAKNRAELADRARVREGNSR